MEYWRKIYEKMLDWELYKKEGCVHLFVHCLLKAAAEDGEIQTIYGKGGVPIKMQVQRGQLFTSLTTLSRETGIDPQKVRRTLNNIANDKAITQQKTQQGTLITVCHFDIYQNRQIGVRTSKRTESETPNDTPSNTLNIKNIIELEENKRIDNNDNNKESALKAISVRAQGRTRTRARVAPEKVLMHWNWAIGEAKKQDEDVRCKEVDYLTPERTKKVEAILSVFTIDDIRLGVHNVLYSAYCNGRTEERQGKVADFDWVFQTPDHFLRCMEGKYNGSTSYETKQV